MLSIISIQTKARGTDFLQQDNKAVEAKIEEEDAHLDSNNRKSSFSNETPTYEVNAVLADRRNMQETFAVGNPQSATNANKEAIFQQPADRA